MVQNELHLGKLKLERMQPLPALFPHMTRIKPAHASLPDDAPIVLDLPTALQSYERYWDLAPSFHERQHTASTASSMCSRDGSVVSDADTTATHDDEDMAYHDKTDDMDIEHDVWQVDWQDPSLSAQYKQPKCDKKEESPRPHHASPGLYGAPWRVCPPGTAQTYRDDKLCRMVSKTLAIEPDRLNLCDRRTLYTLDHLDTLVPDLKAADAVASFFHTMRAHTQAPETETKDYVAYVYPTALQKAECSRQIGRRRDPKENLAHRLDILSHPEAAALSIYDGSLRTSGKTFFVQCLLTELSKLDKPVHVVILAHGLEMENLLLRYLRNAGFNGQRVKTVLEDILHNVHGVYVSSEKSSATKHWSKVDLLISLDVRSSASDFEHVRRVSDPPPRTLHVVIRDSFEEDLFGRLQTLWVDHPTLSWKQLFDQDDDMRRMALAVMLKEEGDNEDDTRVESRNLHEAQRAVDWFLRRETHDTPASLGSPSPPPPLAPSSVSSAATPPPPPPPPPSASSVHDTLLHHVIFADQLLPLPTLPTPDSSVLENPGLAATHAKELGKIQEEYQDKLIQLRQQLMERVLHVLEK